MTSAITRNCTRWSTCPIRSSCPAVGFASSIIGTRTGSSKDSWSRKWKTRYSIPPPGFSFNDWPARRRIVHQVKGMIENFLNLVDTIGLVPNGGRIYYEQRSQPPLLTAMMERYVYATGDVDFLRRNIHLLEKEMQFWLANRTVTVDGHTLARFNVESDGPRPESYRYQSTKSGPPLKAKEMESNSLDSRYSFVIPNLIIILVYEFP